jgi:shikimate dehydrogenase
MPHKGSVIELLDEVSDEARRIGAVNTIARRGDALVGHNTDVAGFIASLERTGAEVAGRSVLVLGAGGAARAVVTALAAMRAREIAVCARRVHGAESVAALGAGGRPASWEERGRLAEGAGIIVNTTPLSVAGEDPLEAVRFEAGQVVVDLVYTPVETRLLARARAEGAQAVDGLGMLLAQAAESVRIWSGMEAPIEIMKRAALPGGPEWSSDVV